VTSLQDADQNSLLTERIQQAMRGFIISPERAVIQMILAIQCAASDGVWIDVSLRIFYERRDQIDQERDR
jgi:hypothetical protein